MATAKKTVSKSVDVSTKKHDRNIHFSYADPGSEFPGELVCGINVREAGGSDSVVRADGYLTKDNPRGLTEAELSQLNTLLNKLVDAAIDEASD